MLLALAISLAVGAIMLVSRRVINPLNTIRDAMLKVAGGDLVVDSGYLDRNDEIGALETFKQLATEKLKIEQHERERNAGAVACQRRPGKDQDDVEMQRILCLRNFTAETLSKFLPFSGQMRSERLPEAGAPDCAHPFGFEVRGAAFQGP